MEAYNLVSLAGVFGVMLLAWACSANRRVVNWRVVLWAVALQLLFGAFVFLSPPGRAVFVVANSAVTRVLECATDGTSFVFGSLGKPFSQFDPDSARYQLGPILATEALATIVFFAALVSVLYYVGLMPLLLRGFAWVFTRLMRLSGAESLCAASNIFVGVESATTIRPYLADMTDSELCTILTVGMGTIASSVLGAYVGMLGTQFQNIAGHLISASLLSAPAALVMSKLLLPETGQPKTLGRTVRIDYRRESNLIEAVINGANNGVRLVVGVVALLLAFIALVALVNLILTGLGGWVNGALHWHLDWSLQGLLGYVGYPFALLVGVPVEDAGQVGRLLGTRAVLTEFYSYHQLAGLMKTGAFVHPRSTVIAAYALCGFAHVASLAIFVGGTAALAPSRAADLARVGPRALLAATLACLMTAAVAGTFFHPGALILTVLSTCTFAAADVTFVSLLEEMIDRDRYARLPSPAYQLMQASSYDRLSKDPADAKGWFANNDWSHFLRSETKDARTEWVMMDSDGPGAVVRFWVGGPVPKGLLRFYLDGADRPALVGKVGELFTGKGIVAPPLSAERARGWNLFLPIPYARHCKITHDGPNFHRTRNGADRIWYNINYRTYAAGTKVQTWTRERFDAAGPALKRVGKVLLASVGEPPQCERRPLDLAPGKAAEATLTGPRAVVRLGVRLKADDLPAALRSVVLSVEFDSEQTVWCPVGDFFGSGVGANAFRGWWRAVDRDGTMQCAWTMPFRKSCTIRFHNVGKQPVTGTWFLDTRPWKWDDRSMYFHANWRQQFPVDTSARHDWRYLTVTGQGVLMGDTLAVMNPVSAWWGEGDEKIFVDGETFPSHFGTGTEDYYGYAWGCPKFFEAPFHAQPRADGPGNAGHTTVTRSRCLDALPFAKGLRFDMEVWHWAKVQMAYAAATYWYARPGAAGTPKPMPAEAARPIPGPPPPFRVKGAFEAEAMKVLARTGGVTEVQRINRYKWSGGAQLWWRDAKPGDKLTLQLNVEADGKYAVAANMTKAVDYGIVQFFLDGEKLTGPVDLYNNGVIVTGPTPLGTRELKAGKHELTVQIKGANPAAVKRHMFGLDYIKLTPVE